MSTAGGVGQNLRPLERSEVSAGERGEDERLTTVWGETPVLSGCGLNLLDCCRFFERLPIFLFLRAISSDLCLERQDWISLLYCSHWESVQLEWSSSSSLLMSAVKESSEVAHCSERILISWMEAPYRVWFQRFRSSGESVPRAGVHCSRRPLGMMRLRE